MEKVEKKAVIIAILLMTMLGFVFLFIFILVNSRVSPDDSSALLNGQPESRFPYAGYMMIDKDQQTFLCGINYLSEDIGLTAAHCVSQYQAIFPNIGTFSEDYTSTSLGGTAFIHPNFISADTIATAGVNDIAVIQLNSMADISEYATVASPSTGCNYYITGYGINENGLNFERRGGEVCIDQVTSERIELTRNAGFAYFCGGDSGSGVYELNTNKLVAIVSAYYPAGDCTAATRFYATRVDANTDFLSDYLELDVTSTPTPVVTSSSIPSNTPTPTIEIEPTDLEPTIFTEVTPTNIFSTSTPQATQILTATSTPQVTLIPTGTNLPVTSIDSNKTQLIIAGFILIVVGLLIKIQTRYKG